MQSPVAPVKKKKRMHLGKYFFYSALLQFRFCRNLRIFPPNFHFQFWRHIGLLIIKYQKKWKEKGRKYSCYWLGPTCLARSSLSPNKESVDHRRQQKSF